MASILNTGLYEKSFTEILDINKTENGITIATKHSVILFTHVDIIVEKNVVQISSIDKIELFVSTMKNLLKSSRDNRIQCFITIKEDVFIIESNNGYGKIDISGKYKTACFLKLN